MSSINVYLKEEVKNKEGYDENQRSHGGQRWTDYCIAGMHIFHDKGRPHISLGDIEDPIPEIVSDIVVGVSLYEWIPLRPKRVSGIYKHETATATVDNHGDRTVVRITAAEFEDLRALYYKIRSGQILPKENWEAEQITASPVKTEETELAAPTLEPEPELEPELAVEKKSKGFLGGLRSRLASIRSK